MRSSFVGMAAAVAAVVLGASQAVAQVPTGDSVTGTLSGRYAVVSVDAMGSPTGENPSGTVSYSDGVPDGGGFGGQVTCLAVTGHTGVIGFSGGYIPIAGAPLFPAAGFVRVVDGGGPGSGLDSFEWTLTAVGPDPTIAPSPPIPGPTNCSSFPGGNTVYWDPGTITGDLVVVDAPSASASEQAAALVTASTGAGPGRALYQKALAIQAAVAAGNNVTACMGIGDYLGLVRAQTGKKLTTAQAERLTNQASNLAALLGC